MFVMYICLDFIRTLCRFIFFTANHKIEEIKASVFGVFCLKKSQVSNIRQHLNFFFGC